MQMGAMGWKIKQRKERAGGAERGTALSVRSVMAQKRKSYRNEAAHQLNQMVLDNSCHLNTGFLSTPFLCEVQTKYGHADTAYRLLLQDSRSHPWGSRCPLWGAVPA